MSRKREHQYGDILNRIDYYLKQADDWSTVGDLDDLITAASTGFLFKDVSARTISMFNVSGESIYNYLSLQMPESVTGWDSSQEAIDTGQPFTIERNKTVEQLNRFTDELFPDGTETSSSTTEAGESIADAIVSDSSYLDYSKDDIFPTQGILLTGDRRELKLIPGGPSQSRYESAGAIRIQRADPKDLSQGYDVYRNIASTEGGSYSTVLPWSDDERVKLNDQPIHNYHNAYKAAVDSMSASSGRPDGSPAMKPTVSLGLGARISRQQRRDLVQKVEKKLASREKAVKKGVRDRTRQRWKDNAQQFLIELPQNAQNAAGEGIRKLGEKALEAADRLKEYEDMFTEQVGEKIREGVEKAKPEIRKALQAVRREAENQFFNAQVTWESAKEFASEKASVIQGVLQQVKVKGSPIWNAATKKGAVLTDKAMYAAGVGLVRAQVATEAVSGFLGRMKSGFQAGYRAEMERQHGAPPSGDKYESDPQGYWEERGKLATAYGKANAEYDREKAIADAMENPEDTRKATDSAWKKFSESKAKVAEDAEAIGANIENVVGHVEKIKSGKGTVLPPAAGWPSAYGGASKVRSLQRNLKIAGLKPYQTASTGIPQAPPAAEAAPAEGGEQLAFDPEAMAGEGQPQAEAAPEAAQAPAQPTAEQPYLPGMAPGAEPGADQQIPMPGMGAEPGTQPVAAGEEATTGPGPQISGKENGGGGAAASVPASEREYATKAPYGLTLHTGEERSDGVATFYDKREAKKAAAAKQQEVAGGGGLAVPGQAGWDAGKQQAGFTSGSTPGPRGQFNMAGENEMAEPINDYKQAAEEEETKAKRSQSKSKIRTARANARMAKARADEAEAKASRSEAESGAKIANMLEKLDREIIELTAHVNPKVSSVLSRLEKAIDSKSKVSSTKK